MLSYELARYDYGQAKLTGECSICGNAGDRWHFRHEMRPGNRLADWEGQPQPSSRTASSAPSVATGGGLYGTRGNSSNQVASWLHRTDLEKLEAEIDAAESGVGDVDGMIDQGFTRYAHEE